MQSDNIDLISTGATMNNEKIKGRTFTKKPKPLHLRGSEEWTKMRPLTFLYLDDRKQDLANLAKSYIKGRISYAELLSKIPETTNWLRSSIRQMIRCQDQKDVLMILGWCCVEGGQIDLDRPPEQSDFTEQQVQCIEEIVGKKCYFTDFFKDCERYEDACVGNILRVQENAIHSIALIVELTVAMREYGIRFRGVFGFAKIFIQTIDNAVFNRIPAMKDLPRAYCPFHIGKIVDKNFEKRRILALEAMAALGKVIGKDKFELYDQMKAWYDARKDLKFELPPLEMESCSRIDEIIEELFRQAVLLPGTSDEASMPVLARDLRSPSMADAQQIDHLPASSPQVSSLSIASSIPLVSTQRQGILVSTGSKNVGPSGSEPYQKRPRSEEDTPFWEAATCEICHRTGHTEENCWKSHPELKPMWARGSKCRKRVRRN